MPSDTFWSEVITAGKKRFPVAFSTSKGVSNNPPKMGVALYREWKPQQLRIDFCVHAKTNEMSVKLLENGSASYQTKRPLIQYAQQNGESLFGDNMRRLNAHIQMKVTDDESQNSLSIVRPQFPAMESVNKEDSIEWYMEAFGLFHDVLLPKLIEEYEKL